MSSGCYRRAAVAAGLLFLAATLAGCVNPDYLAQAKDRYEARHHLKKPAGGGAAGAAPATENKVHPPYGNRECDRCHNQAKGAELRAQGADLCYLAGCHERGKFQRERLHGPVAVGRCSDCHLSHESPHPYHTTAPLPRLCLGCHTFAGGSGDGLKEGYFLHQPVREGQCAKCHDPHGGTRRFFLLAEPADLCLACHDPQVYGGGVVHGPLAVGDCLVCHDPHASRTGRLLKATVTAGLCFRCHTQPRVKCTASAERTDCLTCHRPHRVNGSVNGGRDAGMIR